MIFCSDILRFFFTSTLLCWNGSKILVQTQSLLAKEKPIFYVNTFILFIGHIYRMLTGKVSTANFFLRVQQKHSLGVPFPLPKTNLLSLDYKKRLLMVKTKIY